MITIRMSSILSVLLVLTLVVAVGWLVLDPSPEAALALFSAIAGMAATYRSLAAFQTSGRIALVATLIISLYWLTVSPGIEPLFNLLTSTVGVLNGFNDDPTKSYVVSVPSWDRRWQNTTIPTSSHTLSLARILGFLEGAEQARAEAITVIACWEVVWTVGLVQGFNSFIMESLQMLLLRNEMIDLEPALWLPAAMPIILVWNLAVPLVITFNAFQETSAPNLKVPSSRMRYSMPWFGVGLVFSIFNMWLVCIVFYASRSREGLLAGLLMAVVVIALSHAILVGFLVSISLAVYGFLIGLVWVATCIAARYTLWGIFNLVASPSHST